MGLERGNCEASCIAYAQLGIYAGNRFGHFDAGYRLDVGMRVGRSTGIQALSSQDIRTLRLRRALDRHVREGRELLFRGIDLSSRLGEITYVGSLRAHLTTGLSGGWRRR